MIFCIVDQSSVMEVLAHRVNQRLRQAYRPKTWTTYKSMFLLFLAFCDFCNVGDHPVALATVLYFVEFLAFNGLKPNSIANYLSAIKSQYVWFHLDVTIFDHAKIKLYMKAIHASVRDIPVHKGVFDVEILSKIVQACDSFQFPSIFKSIYLLSFFGFLRISNVAPTSKSSFEITKHLCRGDFFLHQNSAILLIKWSKTLQISTKGTFITIPVLGQSPLCPVRAIDNMIQLYPAVPNAPLFFNWHGVITQAQIRTHLVKIVHFIGLDPKTHTFHTFRRSGATLAFNNNVSIQHIQRQGTWSSDAVNAYIVEDPLHSSSVTTTFQSLLAT